MKKSLLSFVSLCLMPTLLLSGCGPTGSPEETEPPKPSETPSPKTYSNEPIVEAELFKNPTNEYRALQMAHESFQNSTAKQYGNHSKGYLEHGFGGIVTNDQWNNKYLTNEKQLAKLQQYVKAAKANGLRIWIYDEYGFPSGTADGLTVGDKRELQAQALEQIAVQGKGTDPVRVELPKDFKLLASASITTDGVTFSPLTVTVTDDGFTFTGASGAWTAYLYPVRYIDCCYGHKTYDSYPNLLDPAAVRAFIDCTYETYARTIEDFDDVVEAFFDDEPAVLGTRCICNGQVETCPCIPFESTLFDRFQKEFGYELSSALPDLFNGKNDQKSKRVRAQFYHLVAEMLAENFIGQIQSWCRSHGMNFSGHLNNEEYMWYHVPMYGNYMLLAREMGWKGFDVLDLRPAQYLSATSIGGKYATSASWLTNNGRVLVEICPVTDVADFEKDDLNNALGTSTFIYFDGGNQVSSYYPQANVLAPTGQAYNEYVSRLGSLTVNAKNTTNVGVFYGIDTVAANYIAPDTQSAYSTDNASKDNDKKLNHLLTGLREKGLDYVFLDDKAFREGTVRDYGFSVAGFDFTTILVPCAEVMTIETARVLDQLIQKGVNVLFLESIPSLCFTEEGQKEMTELTADWAALRRETVPSMLSDVTAQPALTVTGKSTIYQSPWEKDGKRFFFLANATADEATLSVSMEGTSRFRFYDPVTGEITEGDGQNLKIQAWRALFVQPLDK